MTTTTQLHRDEAGRWARSRYGSDSERFELGRIGYEDGRSREDPMDLASVPRYGRDAYLEGYEAGYAAAHAARVTEAPDA